MNRDASSVSVQVWVLLKPNAVGGGLLLHREEFDAVIDVSADEEGFGDHLAIIATPQLRPMLNLPQVAPLEKSDTMEMTCRDP